MAHTYRSMALAGGLLALLLNTSAQAVSPASIVITAAGGGFANTCSAPPANNPLATIVSNEGAGFSDTFAITAPGFAGYTWTGENGPIGSGSYGFGTPALWGLNVPANTPVTGTIFVYSGINLTGVRIYSSAITWNCTTGVVAGIVNTDLTAAVASTPVPALSLPMILLLGVLAAVSGMVFLRRRAG